MSTASSSKKKVSTRARRRRFDLAWIEIDLIDDLVEARRSGGDASI
jgi:hypothetical protein